MLFNSWEYPLFLPLVTVLYFLMPHRFRWLLLLAASYFFYMYWRAEYALLLAFSTCIDYFAGLGFGRFTAPAARRACLIVSLAMNLGLLFTFKYFNFFMDSVGILAGALDWNLPARHLQVLLPVGISFYTFQTMTYSIDLYRRHLPVERHFGRFALYVSFFPQLVAGPIERAANLLPQFQLVKRFDPEQVVSGFRLLLWGFFKKWSLRITWRRSSTLSIPILRLIPASL